MKNNHQDTQEIITWNILYIRVCEIHLENKATREVYSGS